MLASIFQRHRLSVQRFRANWNILAILRDSSRMSIDIFHTLRRSALEREVDLLLVCFPFSSMH